MSGVFAKNILILVVIAGAMLSLAAVSYEYSSYSSSQVSAMATKDLEQSSQRQAQDLSHILINKVESVDSNLAVVARNQAFQDPTQVESAKQVLSKSQEATTGFTDFYMWLDRTGHMVWISDLSGQNYDKYKNVDLSYRPYFSQPKETLSLYYSTAINSNDDIPRLYVSEPILDGSGNFNGVVTAAMRLDTLGKFLQSQITPNAQGSVGMLDRNGTILYSDDLNAIGENVFGDKFQKTIPDDLRAAGFNDFVHKSLAGGSGVQDLSYRGIQATLAYNTLVISGKDFGVLYVTGAQALSGTVTSVIDQQRLVNISLILVIGALAIGMAVLVLSWNRRLHTQVNSKTAELGQAVASLEEANQRLREHDKMQQEFINIAAHELRTPVQPLTGIAETMQLSMEESGKDSIELSKEEVNMLARNAKRLETLTQNILDVTRIESRVLKLRKERIDLNQKVTNVINELFGTRAHIVDNKFSVEHRVDGGYSGKPKTIRVMLESSDAEIPVEADRTRLFQVVSNIIRNAIKFTGDGGTISISIIKQADNNALVKISDSGEGIDPEILPRLFTKFSTRSQSGTGLGLYLSKAIVEAHGGRIWAENNPDARGASFYFTLPLAPLSHEANTLEQEDKNLGKN